MAFYSYPYPHAYPHGKKTSDNARMKMLFRKVRFVVLYHQMYELDWMRGYEYVCIIAGGVHPEHYKIKHSQRQFWKSGFTIWYGNSPFNLSKISLDKS